jgi:hypothetical protein
LLDRLLIVDSDDGLRRAVEAITSAQIDDGSDRIDQQMARRYLRDCFADGQIEQQLVRMRLAVERLVSSSRRQIEIIVDALLRHGTLTGDEIIAQLNGATW